MRYFLNVLDPSVADFMMHSGHEALLQWASTPRLTFCLMERLRVRKFIWAVAHRGVAIRLTNRAVCR